MSRLWVSVVLMALTGCAMAAMTPQQESALSDVRRFVQAVRAAYPEMQAWLPHDVDLPWVGFDASTNTRYVSTDKHLGISVSAGEAGIPPGVLVLTPAALMYPSRDAALARIMARWVLGDVRPTDAPFSGGEAAVSVKAVEVLAKGRGISEREALRLIHAYLTGFGVAMSPSSKMVGRIYGVPVGAPPANRPSGCQAAAELLAAFPQHQSFDGFDRRCAALGTKEGT